MEHSNKAMRWSQDAYRKSGKAAAKS
jgi:hypothetical protein